MYLYRLQINMDYKKKKNVFSLVQGYNNPIGTFLAKESILQTKSSNTGSAQTMSSSSPVRVSVAVFTPVSAPSLLLASRMIAQIWDEMGMGDSGYAFW
jgi:hypothetical protein